MTMRGWPRLPRAACAAWVSTPTPAAHCAHLRDARYWSLISACLTGWMPRPIRVFARAGRLWSRVRPIPRPELWPTASTRVTTSSNRSSWTSWLRPSAAGWPKRDSKRLALSPWGERGGGYSPRHGIKNAGRPEIGPLWSAAVGRKGDGQYGPLATALVQELALMPKDDVLLYEGRPPCRRTQPPTATIWALVWRS